MKEEEGEAEGTMGGEGGRKLEGDGERGVAQGNKGEEREQQ